MKNQVINWRDATDFSCQICTLDAKVAQDGYAIRDSVKSQRRDSNGIDLAILYNRTDLNAMKTDTITEVRHEI